MQITWFGHSCFRIETGSSSILIDPFLTGNATFEDAGIPLHEAIKAAIAEHEVGALVLGLPINLDGTEGPRAQSTRAFARNLAPHIKVPILFWDERLSTAAVERHLIEAGASRKRRAEVIDRMAAAYILQGALDRLTRLTA